MKAATDPWVTCAAVLAAAAPSLLAYNQPPSPTFLNQALALALWGVFVVVGPSALVPARSTATVGTALAGVAAAAVASSMFGTLPNSLALSALGMLACAAVLLLAGASAGGATDRTTLFTAFCLAWVVAGGINAGVAAVQVFAPAVADGNWIARSSYAGRAVGNLRQPNHLSSLLLWAAIATVALLALGRLRQRTAWALMTLFIFAVVLTASRTGLVSVLLLGAWGLFDRRLPGVVRRLLTAAPVFYAAAWWGMWAWADAGAHAFGGQARLAETDISSSRFGIWANTLDLIARQPWAGVGFGRFNLAWSLTPFPGRPTAFFDHAHNLPLQLLAELGLPLGTGVLAGLGWALWRAWNANAGDVSIRFAAMFVVMIGVHSGLEYPLWYAYFLLPTAWAWGYALAAPERRETRNWTPAAGVLVVLGATLAVLDYQRVANIFEARPDAPPLAQRIAEGRRSWLFGHHADYAAATSVVAQPDGIRVFDRPLHYLLDTRLMVAWAGALHMAGRDDEARYVAQRLREFGTERAQTFFAECTGPASAAAYACQPPTQPHDWRDLLAR